MATDWSRPPELEFGAMDGDACMCGYGFFPGGDPRLFRPDPECSTPEERALWRTACERWDLHEEVGVAQAPEPRVSRLIGNVIACGSQFGMGSYRCRKEPH